MAPGDGLQGHAQRHTRVHIFAGNWEWGGADMGSQVDMHTCIDAYTHPNQDVGQMRADYHEERSIQGCTCLCATMQR